MGLTLDEYRKMKKEGRVKWDANTVRGSQKEITDFLTAAAGTNSRNFDKNKEAFGALSAKKRYLQAYVNSLKGTEGYEQARDTFTELNTAYNKAGDYFKSIKNGQEITDGVKKMTAYGAGAGIGAAATAEKSVPAETRLEALQKEREKINSEISGRRYQGSGAAQETSDLKKQLESYDRRIEETRQEIAGNAERDAEVNERERNVRLKAKYGGLGYKQLLNAYSHTENDAERAYLKSAIEKEMTENHSPEIIKASIRELESQSEADSRRAAGAQPYDGAEKLKQGSIAHIQKMYGDEISLLKSILPKAERLEKKNRYMLSKYAEDFEESSKLIEEKPIKNVMGSPVTVVGNQKREDRDELDKKKYMTDEEQAVYNYLYNKKGLETADDFVRTIEPDLNERMTRTQEEKARELADSGFWGGLAASVQSLGFNLASGGGVIEDIVRQATGQELDTKSVWHLPANLRNAERETVEKNIEDPLMKKLYGVLMSTADSAVNMLITKGAGTVAGAFGAGTEAAEKIATGIGSFIFSSQAATQEVIEAKAKGLDDGQAVGLGIIHGLAEYISEKYSIEQILSDPDIWYKAIAKAGFAEGSEEVASNWITRPFDLMIEGDKNENIRRYNEYLKQGYSKTEAVTKLLGDFVTEDTEAFAAGALSGVGMSGASRGYNYISEKISEAHEKHLDKKAFISFCDKLAKEAETMPDYEAAKAELIEQAKNSGIKKAVKMAERFEQQLETLKSADIANLMYVMETEKAEPAAAETETVTEKAEPAAAETEPETEKAEPAAAKVEPETEKTGPAAARTETETADTETAPGIKTEKLNGRYYSDGQRVIDGEKLQVHPFGRSNKEGIWAYSIKNGDKTFKLTMVESSEREQGANDNTVTFKTEDGRTVTSDEITFLSRDMQLIADYAKNFDTLGARAAFSSFESYKEHAGEKADTGEYLKTFEKAYQLGQRGVSYDAAKSYKSRGLEAVERVIGATAARFAVNAGVNDRQEQLSFESQSRVRLSKTGQSSGTAPGVELDITDGSGFELSDGQKQILQAVAEKTGRSVVVSDKLEPNANGLYDPKDGKIYVSADVENSEYMTAVALHEAVHGLRDADPEAYGVLEGFITNYLEEKGVSIDRLIDDINERWGRRDDTAAMEELVCQTVMAVATDENALKTAIECEKNRGLLERALDAVKKIAESVKRFIKGVASDGRTINRNNLQAQPWIKDAQALDRLAQELSKALDAQRESLETFEQKKDTPGGVRYSIADSVTDDNGNVYENVVVLDTDIFHGVKPRYWNKVLNSFVYDNLEGRKITAFDDDNNEITIEFARKNERVQKDGAKRSHKVIEKLARKTDRNSQQAVAHAKELIEVSKELPGESGERNHQWLDENGWTFRSAYIMTEDGKIYSANLNIAHTKDGRSILYDINKITDIGHGDVPSDSERRRGSRINPDIGNESVAHFGKNVNPKKKKRKNFAVDDSINDELLELDEELFWEDNRKYIDEFIKADPESSVLAIYNSISKTAEGVIRGFKGVRLKDKDHRSIARQIMRKYDIKAAISPDAEERIAERVERFVKDVRSGDGAEFFELLNELASDCKTFIAESGHFDNSWMQEERETLLDMLKGRTLIIRNYEEDQILENFGGMKGLRRAFLGKVNVGYERNLDNIRNPAYIEEIAEAFGEQFAALVDDSEKDSFEGWTWLDRMLNSTLKPKFVNPFYDGVRESADTAAVEMAFEMTNGVVKKISEAAARDKTADKKSIRELKEKNALAFSEKEALAKAKAEKYKKLAEEEKQRRIEQRKRYIERIDNAREYSAEQRQKMQKRLNRLNREYEKYKGSWLEEKKSAREEYIEAREKVRYRKLLAKELGRMTKMLDGKTNNNQYIPEQLKAPVLGLLSAFEVETPGGKRLPHYWQSFKSLDDVGARLDELLDEYKRLKSAKPAENVFGDMFNADGMEFDEELYNGLENLKEQVRGKNVYALNSNDLKGIYEGIRALDAQLKAAAQVIIDGKTAFAKQAAADAVDETLAFKDRSKGARSLLNAAVSWHLDPVRFGRFLSGYNDDHVVAKLFRDLHEGDKKRVRIIYKAFTEIERTLGSEFTGKERRALQIKDVEQFDFRDRKTKERVKITDGMLLSIYLTNRQKAGHRHLVNDKFDHYTVIPDLDMLNRDNIPVIGNVVSELSNSKSRARDPQFRHEVRFTEEDLTQINSYIEHNERLMKLADAISEVFNGQIKDEINKVSLQRYGKMIATVSEYFPIVTDRLDPNKKYRTEIGDSLRDLRVKSRSFTKNRSFSYNAIVIDDVLSVFARHVQETAEYCGMLMPVENFKRIYTISGGDMTLEGALAEKFGGSAGKYIAHLMDDIQKPKDMRDENILVRAGGHLMSSVLMLNPGATIKQFAAYPTAFKYFGITNVSKAIPASVIKGKKLVEKYSEYTPYMWYRENGNGAVVADVSRQLSLRNKINNFFDIMGKTDKFVVNSLLYAAQEHVRKKRGDLAFDSEEFKQEVARQFENAIDESQPNNMLTSKPQFVRNNTLRTLSLNAFLSQNMAMGNGVIDSVLELAVRTNEFRTLKTEESKKAFAAAVKKFFSHSFGVVLSGAFLSALKQIADLLIYHKWDDTKDEEGKTAWDKIAGRWFGDFVESVAGAFAQGDFIVNTIASIFSGDPGRYNSLSVRSLGKLDELVKSVQQGNYLKFYGAVMDMSGLPLLGGNNIQRLLKGTSLTAKDIILGNAYPIGAGYTVFKNNGELDTKALSYHVVERIKNGEKNKAEDYVKLWREDIVSNKGKSAEDANAEIKDKLAEALAESDDDVTEMAVARENESYGEYDRLFEKITGYGFDPADVEKAADKALTLIRKEIKENGAEDIEAELERRGFNSEAVRKLMKKWRFDNINELMEDVFDKEEASPFDDTSSGKAVQYTVRDGFNALKNGDDTLDDIREYVVEHSESISTAEEFDKRIRSGTYVNPLIKEYLEALDGKDEERRSELKKQLVNIFGSWNEASGAIKKYQKKVGQ